MISDEILRANFRNERDQFAQTLQSFVLIDIGTITSVSKDGRAEVRTNIFVGDQQVVYQNAEVIYPGNQGGGYTSAVAGTSCLIFMPRSCMPDITSQLVQFGSAVYDKAGVKVMPIANGSTNAVKTMFSTLGAFSIYSPAYSLTFTEDTVTLQRTDGNVSITMDQEGSLYVEYLNSLGNELQYIIDKTGIHKQWVSQDKSVIWADTLNADGSRSFVQSDGTNEEADPLCSITIGTNGAVTINTASNINVSTTGDASVDADGDVSVNANQINLNGNGKSLVTYEALKDAMDILYTALTTTAITGNGSMQPTWAGLDPLTKIDISGAEASTLKTGNSP